MDGEQATLEVMAALEARRRDCGDRANPSMFKARQQGRGTAANVPVWRERARGGAASAHHLGGRMNSEVTRAGRSRWRWADEKATAFVRPAVFSTGLIESC